jgi:hypothetical protein
MQDGRHIQRTVARCLCSVFATLPGTVRHYRAPPDTPETMTGGLAHEPEPPVNIAHMRHWRGPACGGRCRT